MLATSAETRCYANKAHFRHTPECLPSGEKEAWLRKASQLCGTAQSLSSNLYGVRAMRETLCHFAGIRRGEDKSAQARVRKRHCEAWRFGFTHIPILPSGKRGLGFEKGVLKDCDFPKLQPLAASAHCARLMPYAGIRAGLKQPLLAGVRSDALRCKKGQLQPGVRVLPSGKRGLAARKASHINVELLNLATSTSSGVGANALNLCLFAGIRRRGNKP